jgi:hypothetical protein
MKIRMLFEHDDYYPLGGVEDFVCASLDPREDLRAMADQEVEAAFRQRYPGSTAYPQRRPYRTESNLYSFDTETLQFTKEN